jgi:phosphohistidine phosphatase
VPHPTQHSATIGGMRRDLLLVRHVKSAWDDPSLADHDRPIAPRGMKAVRQLRDYLKRSDYRPTVVLCSSSRRTVDTLDGIRAALPKRATVEVTDDLYLASADTLLARLHALDGTTGCAMVVGHNPAIEDLAAHLVGSGDTALRQQLAAKVPTGALVALSFDGAWTDLGAGDARIDALFLPTHRGRDEARSRRCSDAVTLRGRHGSSRAWPLSPGGGVTFGPAPSS